MLFASVLVATVLLALPATDGAVGNSTCTGLANHQCWYDSGAHVVQQIPCTLPKQADCVSKCCTACDANPKCLAFTMNFDEQKCYLKDGEGITEHSGNCTSGGTVVPTPAPSPGPVPPAPVGALNVLMILIDDLRPELGLYGSKVLHADGTTRSLSPNLDQFAARDGVTVFHNAYVQYSFCCPSRNSFMVGRRPSKTKTWNFIDDFRHAPAGSDPQGPGSNWTSMPEWFKDRGYFVHGLGKLFHPGKPANFDPPSWSDPAHVSDGSGQTPDLPSSAVWPDSDSTAWRHNGNSTALADTHHDDAEAKCMTGEPGGSYCELPPGSPGPDDQLADNGVASVGMLASFSAATGRPFFLGVGFHKPHIPWTIPHAFFQPLAAINATALPVHPAPPAGMPPIAWNKGLGTHALDSYADANQHGLHAFANGSYVAFPDPLTQAMRRGYYAAVSYTDHNIGRLLDALDASPAANNTVVVIMGDHGYSLGELNLWCKMTVFEAGTRVPLLFRVPAQGSDWSRQPAQATSSLVEAVDLFPTLAVVAGQANATALPAYLDGTNLAPVLRNGTAAVKQAAFSEFVKCYSCCRVPDDQPCLEGGPGGRCPPNTTAGLADLHEMANCFHVDRASIDFIGYSVRTSRWRYTEWLRFNGTLLHGDFTQRVGRELYDHQGDDGGAHDWDRYELQNVVDEPANAQVVSEHHALLAAGFAPPRSELLLLA